MIEPFYMRVCVLCVYGSRHFLSSEVKTNVSWALTDTSIVKHWGLSFSSSSFFNFFLCMKKNETLTDLSKRLGKRRLLKFSFHQFLMLSSLFQIVSHVGGMKTAEFLTFHRTIGWILSPIGNVNSVDFFPLFSSSFR